MFKMISSCTGHIRRIAFARTGNQLITSPEVMIEKEYLDLVQSLPPYCQIIWIGLFPESQQECSFAVRGRKVTCATVADIVPKGLAFKERWIRDHFLCLGEKGSSTLVLPRQSMPCIEPVSMALSKALPIKLYQSSLAFEGGNLLSNGNRLFAGYDLLQQNGLEPGKALNHLYLKAAEAKLMGLTGAQEVVWIGSQLPLTSGGRSFGQSLGTHQPFYHIDLFLTLIGNNYRGIEQVLLANPRLLYPASDRDKSLLSEIQCLLFDIEATLYEKGLEVHRIPLGILNAPGQWKLLAYNNCLAECVPGTRTLYLPDYVTDIKTTTMASKINAIAELQQEVTEILDGLGIRSHWLHLNYDAKKMGALHCLTQILERD